MMPMVRQASKHTLPYKNSLLSLPFKVTLNDLYVCVCVCVCYPARRLAMYQEMDSEEEECTSHGGTLPRRDSVTSHQSARVVLRSHSTKSHRRTGSRAEAKRASILSKHTAFSSPMVSAPQRHAVLVLCTVCSPLINAPLSCRRKISPPTLSS